MKRIKWILPVLCLLLTISASAGGTAQTKYAALTFDDGPSGRYTRRLLEGLSQREARATFFLCGYRIEQMPKLVGEILEGGHEIALHGYSHKAMDRMSLSQISQELTDTQALLEAPSILLRPPGGQCSQTVRAAAAQQGLAIVTWSVDPKDWATSNTAAIVQRVVSKVQDGDVILLHDMTDSSVDAALEIVDQLTAKGYQFVTVSELAALRGCTLEPGTVYSRFPPPE